MVIETCALEAILLPELLYRWTDKLYVSGSKLGVHVAEPVGLALLNTAQAFDKSTSIYAPVGAFWLTHEIVTGFPRARLVPDGGAVMVMEGPAAVVPPVTVIVAWQVLLSPAPLTVAV